MRTRVKKIYWLLECPLGDEMGIFSNSEKRKWNTPQSENNSGFSALLDLIPLTYLKWTQRGFQRLTADNANAQVKLQDAGAEGS